MNKKAFYLVLAVTILTFNLFSQEKDDKEQQIPPIQHEIVVTATRIETPAKEIASSVSVISKEELERTKKITLLEALQEILGLSLIQNGPSGGAASVFLRGANSEHTLVMMDGVELNDPISPSRSFDLAHITLENIERIEVLRGPQSTLYGSDALSGVVNIITKKGSGKPRFSLSSLGGSYGTFINNAGMSGSSGKISYSLGVSHFQSQGLSAASTTYEGNEEKDGYKNLSLSGRLGFNPSENLEIDLIIRTFKTKTEIDNFGGAYGDDPNNTQNYDAFFLKGQIRSLFLRSRWEQKLGFSFVSYDRQYENPTDESHPFDSDNSLYKSRLLKIDWQNNLFLHEANTLTFGIDYQQEQGESEYYSNSRLWSYSSIFPLKRAYTTGFYIQDQIRVASLFFTTLGVRLDNHSQFGTSLTYRIAPACFIEQTGTKFKATYGIGFKSPSLYQLYAPGTSWGPIGNEALEPEKSIGWDVGIEQQILGNNFMFGATYFSNNYKNLINFDSIQGFINIGKAESRGMEFFVRTIPVKGLFLKASCTKTEAKDKDKDTYLLRRPKDKLTASLNYQFIEKSNINLSLVYIGECDDEEYSGWIPTRVTLPSYTLINSAVSFNITPSFQIFCRLDNIFNEKYEMIKGYGTPGFSAYGGLKLIL